MSDATRLITVTGATGFVGRTVVERLLQETDVRVRCLVRPDSDRSKLSHLQERVHFVPGDITRPQTLASAFDGAWGVINLAGYREFWSESRTHYYDINQQGADNVFRACLKAEVGKVVQVSTPLAFGVPKHLPFNESSAPGQHTSDYGRSKYLGDEAGWQLLREEDLPLTVVYLAAVIGAGDDKATMEVRRAVENRLPALVGADTTYTYVYVKDAAEAIVRALFKDDTIGNSYLIGDQRATTRAYFDTIGALADVTIPRTNIPEAWLMPVAKTMEWIANRTGRRPVIPVDVIKTTAAGSLLFDASLGKKALGLTYTPLESALAEAVEEIRGC